MEQRINKNGKYIVKKGTPKVFETIINGKRIKYWFWKIMPSNDFEELWLATERQIMQDSVEYAHLRALLRKRYWGDDLTVWDGEEYNGKISTYWYNTGAKGDDNIDLKKLTDLYTGEWYVVDENGIPYIEKEREEMRKQQAQQHRPQQNQQPLHQTNYTSPNTPIIQVNKPQVQPQQGTRIVINKPNENNSALNRGRQIVINPSQPTVNQPQNRPQINVIKRNF